MYELFIDNIEVPTFCIKIQLTIFDRVTMIAANVYFRQSRSLSAFGPHRACANEDNIDDDFDAFSFATTDSTVKMSNVHTLVSCFFSMAKLPIPDY